MAVFARWHHCIDHADKQTQSGRITVFSRRSSAADRQSVKLDYALRWVTHSDVMSTLISQRQTPRSRVDDFRDARDIVSVQQLNKHQIPPTTVTFETHLHTFLWWLQSERTDVSLQTLPETCGGLLGVSLSAWLVLFVQCEDEIITLLTL